MFRKIDLIVKTDSCDVWCTKTKNETSFPLSYIDFFEFQMSIEIKLIHYIVIHFVIGSQWKINKIKWI